MPTKVSSNTPTKTMIPFSIAASNMHRIGGAKQAGELDAKRAMLEGAELAARL